MVKAMMVDSHIPRITPSEGIIISMYFCISLFEERKPCFIRVSILRKVQCSRPSLVHHLIPFLHVPYCVMGGDQGISRSFFGMFKILRI